MQLERRPIESLTADPANARKHDERNLEAIRSSLARFGQQRPILVDKNGVVRAGNGTLAAAKLLGWTEIDVVVSDLMTETELAAYAIVDNRTTDLSSFDDAALASTIGALLEDGVPLELLGFTDREFAAISPKTMEDGLTDPDDIPTGVDRFVQSGDLWVLGRHRLLCGDSTEAVTFDRLLDGRKPMLMVTDPPYGVSYDPAWRDEEFAVQGGARKTGVVTADDRADWSAVWAMFPGDVAYCWIAAGNLQITAGLALVTAGYEIRNEIIWRKPHLPIGRGHYRYQHEPCWYAVRKGGKAHWIGDHSASTVWEVALDDRSGSNHSTQKPVECMARPMRNHKTDSVLDPFVGSGTSIIAAEQTGVECLAVEIDPQYASDAVRRWENFTGEKAELLRREEAK